MENTPLSLTTIVLFAPLVGMIVLLFIPRVREDAIRWVTLAVTVITFILTLLLGLAMDFSDPGLQHVTLYNWIPTWGISFYVGVDGMSFLLVLLTALIMPPAVLISFKPITDRVKLYYALLLLLEWAMIGVFVAQDLFLFYVMW